MDNTNTNPDKIPELDSETANQLLNNIFAECEVVPNAIPLETLESWGILKDRVSPRQGHLLRCTRNTCPAAASLLPPYDHRAEDKCRFHRQCRL